MTATPLSALPDMTGKTAAIFGSYVLAEDGEGDQQILRDRWVITEGDRIAAISDSRSAADLVLDRPGRFVLPGMMNLHNHCFSEALARTVAEDGAGPSGGKSVIYTILLPLSRTGLAVLDSGERLAAARMGVLQLLLGGAASVMEPFRNTMPEMFVAAEEMGLRFWGAPYVFSSSNPVAGRDGVSYGTGSRQGRDNSTDLAVWDALHAEWHGRGNGRIGVTMSPHATDTCDIDLLRMAGARARELGVPITIHLAQSAEEVATIKARWGGRTPAEYLDWADLLGPDLLAAHCVYCSDADLALMKARDVTVLNCPRVFVRTAKTAAFSRFHEAGLRTTVGTDGYNLDLLGELNAAATVSKVASADPRAGSAQSLLRAVTRDAAQAVGRDDLGRIAVGAKADLTVIDLTHPHLQPLRDPRRAVVALGNRANIDAVMVDGRLLVEGGRFLHGDMAAIMEAGTAAIHKVWNQPHVREALDAAAD